MPPDAMSGSCHEGCVIASPKPFALRPFAADNWERDFRNSRNDGNLEATESKD
jgi:hypothetical protein